ncbi:MAG: hypothetical protein HQL31_12870 [Planctomycetes bacterium]|nr:hypothetical protein [Planctomycetota bacterium]
MTPVVFIGVGIGIAFGLLASPGDIGIDADPYSDAEMIEDMTLNVRQTVNQLCINADK